jgi:hypothetical protein
VKLLTSLHSTNENVKPIRYKPGCLPLYNLESCKGLQQSHEASPPLNIYIKDIKMLLNRNKNKYSESMEIL